MYVQARVIGLSRDEFWSLTLREYSRECTAANRRARADYNRCLTQAWHTIRYLKIGWAKQLPKLESEYLSDRDALEKPRQTPAQMRQVLERLGMKARPMSEEAKKATRLIH